MRENAARWPLLALVGMLPFELRATFLGLSNLQWCFIILATTAIPALIAGRAHLYRDRLLQPAFMFVAVQWLATAFAAGLQANAAKASIRFTAGLVLFAIVRTVAEPGQILRLWRRSAGLAAAVALAGAAGYGIPSLFRVEEFYAGQVHRLSGTFEYPNTAAAFYGVSIPIAWPHISSELLLWPALVLTRSRGAMAAVAAVSITAAVIVRNARIGSYRLLLAAAAGIGFYAVVTANKPLLAEYNADFNELRDSTADQGLMTIRLRNTGRTWPASGLGKLALSYRWYDIDKHDFASVYQFVTPLPRDIPNGDSLQLQASFRTPEEPGHYLLAWELFSGNKDWLSHTGVFPFLVESDIETKTTRIMGNADTSRWYRLGHDPAILDASISRSDLWKAAWKIARAHPFGAGPDSFRLLYGQYLGAKSWDTHIYSNNLYLEVLTGSGFLGLGTFLLMLARIQWRIDAACLAVAIFLIHGLVDVFLMTTPIYFAFWILLGLTPKTEAV